MSKGLERKSEHYTYPHNETNQGEETMNKSAQLNLDDIELIEGGAETEQEYYEAIQKAINSGIGWKMQGSYGRTMMDAIRSGCCMLGIHRAQDYYGNTIPSRDDVEEGTYGSFEYVIEMHGQDWADLMGSL